MESSLLLPDLARGFLPGPSTPAPLLQGYSKTSLLTCCGGQYAFLILVFTSCSVSSMKMAELGSLLDIFSWPCSGAGAQGSNRPVEPATSRQEVGPLVSSSPGPACAWTNQQGMVEEAIHRQQKKGHCCISATKKRADLNRTRVFTH